MGRLSSPRRRRHRKTSLPLQKTGSNSVFSPLMLCKHTPDSRNLPFCVWTINSLQEAFLISKDLCFPVGYKPLLPLISWSNGEKNWLTSPVKMTARASSNLNWSCLLWDNGNFTTQGTCELISWRETNDLPVFPWRDSGRRRTPGTSFVEELTGNVWSDAEHVTAECQRVRSPATDLNTQLPAYHLVNDATTADKTSFIVQ